MKTVLITAVLTVVLLALSACGTPVEGGIRFATADPALSLFVPVAGAEVGESEPDPLPVPPCVVVKGNISRDGRKLYHVEGMANFNQVRINEAAGERFFCSTAEAEAAGWVRAGN